MNPRFWPAEWAPQAATLLVWPLRDGDWGRGLDDARATLQAMVNALVPHQPVVLIAPDNDARTDIGQRQSAGQLAHDGVCVADVPADDIWVRDSGPITVFDAGARHFIDFRFDGWGGKYPARADDALCQALHVAGWLGADPLDRQSLVLEGGSIETNGAGTVLTTTRCLLEGRRNAGVDRERLTDVMTHVLGAGHIHWLEHGELIGDDTDGHIDTLARFVDTATIVYQACDDPQDAHHTPLAALGEALAGLRDTSGQPYRLIALPLPAPQFDPDDGHRLPAGYANFLIANGCILMPAFDDPADEQARAILARCFPSRRIIAIDSRALIRQHGGIHCATMQIPALMFA